MQLSENLRARISALGELSRPLGEQRATAIARALVNAVATEVAHGRDPDATIDSWIRRIAAEVVEKGPGSETRSARKPTVTRRIGDVLPEIH